VLTNLISTHPFALLHGGQLSYADWHERLEAVTAQINQLQPPSDALGLSEEDRDNNGNSETPQAEEDQETQTTDRASDQGTNAATSEDLMKLQLTKRYYTEALKFIQTLHEASEIISQLLASKNKSEVLESMDFFVVADAYKLVTAKVPLAPFKLIDCVVGN